MAGPIAVYGATGYTGALVAHELRRRGLACVLAGRDGEKLARLADALGGGVPTRAVELDDRSGLRHLLGDCAAVIDCAGPFVRWGEPVVRAAVETGTHYVDTAGEQAYMRLVRDRYDDAARAAEVAVVPAMGFDYVPGDLLAHVTAQGAEPLRELVVAYAVRGMRPSRGTARSVVGVVADRASAYEDGRWRTAPLRTGLRRLRFPEPFGVQPVMSYPSGEVLTVPHHVRTRKVTSLIAVETVAGRAQAAPLLPLLVPALGLALRTPLRAAVEWAVERMPEGPSPRRRAAARFAVVALAHGEDGHTRRGVVHGADIYGLTAVTVVHGAALMAQDGYDRAGVLSPATAYAPAPFLDALAEHGVAYEVVPSIRSG